MNASEVIDKILSDGKAEAQQIITAGHEQINTLKSGYDSELEKFKQQTEMLVNKAAEDKKMRVLAAARMQVSKSYLAAKHEVLDSVFDKAAQAIIDYDDQKYLELISKFIKSTIETGDESIIIGENENRINDDFIRKLNRELGTGFKGNLMLVKERAHIKGGFILQRGKIRINVSLEVLLDMAREKLESQLAQELFG